jgi:hypothetical protein
MKHVDDSDCTEEGFFPYPGVCKKFPRCAWNPVDEPFTEYIFDCASGTDLWCQSLRTCTYEQLLIEVSDVGSLLRALAQSGADAVRRLQR